jgi:hypothetical protein
MKKFIRDLFCFCFVGGAITFVETRHALSLHGKEHESLKLGEWIG